MRITRAVVPSLFTVLNAFCGFLSILYASQGRIEMAAWFIILGGGFDAFDGIMARITRSSSQFGVELDSLADVVSFGAAPSFLVYQAHLSNLESLGVIISSMPLLFGAIRLARFNVQLVGFEKDHFKGLPIPAAAIAICAYLLQYNTERFGLNGWTRDGLAILVVVLSFLMVSKVRYDTLPKLTKRGIRAHPWRAIAFSLAGVVVLVSKGNYLFYVTAAFIGFGILRALYEWIRSIATNVEKDPEGESEISSIDI
ncbi:MAG: CDP-diacylglycerol--serine O-phosphatidyltransferase [Ignavibacteria bacterium]|jgi:CDP-diacylglycerol--serine O-phosphatidyltransferase|nr:CDP-diacylglycerol--serine O-phosphatidyltransferase [Ignavibacteria bacterium]